MGDGGLHPSEKFPRPPRCELQGRGRDYSIREPGFYEKPGFLRGVSPSQDLWEVKIYSEPCLAH